MAGGNKGFWDWLWSTDENRGVSPRYVGLIVAVVVAGTTGFTDLAYQKRVRTSMLKPFEVIESRRFCQMQYKPPFSKNWRTAALIDCVDVGAYKLANPDKRWSTNELMHHRIWLGEERTELPLFLPETSLSVDPLGPNDEGYALVSPKFNNAEPMSHLIARPRTPKDNWISFGFYGLAMVLIAGGEYFHRPRKFQTKY